MKKTTAEHADAGDGFDASKPWAGMVPVDSVVRNPGQPRTEFPAAELEALAVALRAGQAQPCTVIPFMTRLRPKARWMLVDGECRWRAAQRNKMAELFVCYKPGVTQENLHRVSFASNFCRLSHTKEETAKAIDKERASGQTYEQIAAMVGKTAPWAVQMHQLLQLHPKLLKFMDEADPETGRKLNLKVALLMVNQPKEKQLATYLKVRSKTSSEQYHKVRQTGVVGSNRTPSDDFVYVKSLLNTAFSRLATLASVGEVMMRRFSDEQLGEIGARLEEIEKRAAKFREERLRRAECRVGSVLALLAWSEARTEVVMTWLALGVSIGLVMVALLMLGQWVARAVANSVQAYRYERGLEELRGWEAPESLLSKEDMELLLVNAGLMGARRIQEDGCGLVNASVLGWSWQITGAQMSVFLAWCRGRTVETPDGRRWTAFVKVDAEKRPEGAWIVLRPQISQRTQMVITEAFEEALERARSMNGQARPHRHDLEQLWRDVTPREVTDGTKASAAPCESAVRGLLTEGGQRS